MSIEEPKFTSVLKEGAFELRDYARTIVAEVTVTGDQQEASRKGFRLLAGYIFGGNRGQVKIAMTAPVTKIAEGQEIAMTAPVTQTAGRGDWLVRFTMPNQYALADLPLPNDPKVTLKALPAARLAVLRFSQDWRVRQRWPMRRRSSWALSEHEVWSLSDHRRLRVTTRPGRCGSCAAMR